MNFREFVLISRPSLAEDSVVSEAVDSYLQSTGHPDGLQVEAYEWMCRLIQSGASPSVRKRYSAVLSDMFSRFATTGDNPFDRIGEMSGYRLKKEDVSAGNLGVLDGNISRWYGVSASNQVVGVFIYMLLTATFSIEQVLNLTFDNATDGISQIDEFLSSSRTHHRQTYVFKFERNRTRMPRLCAGVAGELAGILKGAGMVFPEGIFTEDEVAALWIRKAIESGIPFSRIRAIISRIPEQFSYLSLLPSEVITEDERLCVLQRVADSFIKVQPEWHVMKLRRNVSKEKLESHLAERLPGVGREVTFFYPTRSVVSKVGKKTVKEDVPYLPGILFFRVRTDKVTAIFREIGEYAWCYRRTNSPDSPYTVIPRREMELFQMATGQFSEDMEIDMVNSEPIGIGRKVRILTGPMAGKETTVYDIREKGEQSNSRRVCYLRISSLSNIRWTLALPENSLQPI